MCRSMMRPLAEAKSIALGAQIAPDAGEINADRRAVQQILINLVSNAVKFTPDGGSVVIGAKRVGSRLHFWVSDTGIGIAEEDFANLGKPFVQIQNDYTRRFEGTGLGRPSRGQNTNWNCRVFRCTASHRLSPPPPPARPAPLRDLRPEQVLADERRHGRQR